VKDGSTNAMLVPASVTNAHCQRCNGERNCFVRSAYEKQYHNGGAYWSRAIWEILECGGCEFVFVRVRNADEEHYREIYTENEDPDIEYVETIRYHPSLPKISMPEWVVDDTLQNNTHTILRELLKEIYVSLNAGNRTLSVSGIRASFETTAILLGAKTGKIFREQIKYLLNAGHIKNSDLQEVELLVEVGNASVHRAWIPSDEHVEAVTHIMESLIYRCIVIPLRGGRYSNASAGLLHSVPKRQRSKD